MSITASKGEQVLLRLLIGMFSGLMVVLFHLRSAACGPEQRAVSAAIAPAGFERQQSRRRARRAIP